jgi:hypothetical protein
LGGYIDVFRGKKRDMGFAVAMECLGRKALGKRIHWMPGV